MWGKWKLFTWEITSDGCRSKIIALGQSHSRYVQAVPPFMLPVNIYHHLKNRGKPEAAVTFRGSQNINSLAFGSQFCSQRQVYWVFWVVLWVKSRIHSNLGNGLSYEQLFFLTKSYAKSWQNFPLRTCSEPWVYNVYCKHVTATLLSTFHLFWCYVHY